MRVLRRRKPLGEGVAKLVGEVSRGRPGRRIEREHPVDERAERLRQVRPGLGERRGAGLDPPRRLEQRAVPERMPARERLPEHRPDRPDVGRRPARLAVHQPLGRHVGERPGHVAGGGQRLLLGELREPEVEQPRGQLLRLRPAGRWRASRRGGRSRARARVRDPRAPARPSRPPPRRPARRPAAPRAWSAPGRTRRRCRRCASRGRARRRAGSARAAVAPPPGPPVRPGSPPCPRAGRSSARRRGPCARRAPARPSRSRRCPAGAGADSAPQRARWWKGQAPPRTRDLGVSPGRPESCAGRPTR